MAEQTEPKTRIAESLGMKPQTKAQFFKSRRCWLIWKHPWKKP